MENNKVNDCFTSAENTYEAVSFHTAPVMATVSKEDYVAGSLKEMVGEEPKKTEE